MQYPFGIQYLMPFSRAFILHLIPFKQFQTTELRDHTGEKSNANHRIAAHLSPHLRRRDDDDLPSGGEERVTNRHRTVPRIGNESAFDDPCLSSRGACALCEPMAPGAGPTSA